MSTNRVPSSSPVTTLRITYSRGKRTASARHSVKADRLVKLIAGVDIVTRAISSKYPERAFQSAQDMVKSLQKFFHSLTPHSPLRLPAAQLLAYAECYLQENENNTITNRNNYKWDQRVYAHSGVRLRTLTGVVLSQLKATYMLEIPAAVQALLPPEPRLV